MFTTIPDAFADVLSVPEVQIRTVEDDGPFPNNPALPMLVLRRAVRTENGGVARALERVFGVHEWRVHWRNGVFPYHHYHSTAHEVLGIAAGAARVRLGGPEGDAFEVDVGDVLVLPAGVAHKNLDSESDFLVVGAYPAGQDWDLKRRRPGKRPDADRNIERVSLPSQDPVYGERGPLVEHWDLRA